MLDIHQRLVVKPGEFVFSVIGLDHGHIYGMSKGLMVAGAEIKWVYDPDREKVKKFLETIPEAMAAESEEQVLNDPDTKLIASDCITCDRALLGVCVMKAGKLLCG